MPVTRTSSLWSTNSPFEGTSPGTWLSAPPIRIKQVATQSSVTLHQVCGRSLAVRPLGRGIQVCWVWRG